MPQSTSSQIRALTRAWLNVAVTSRGIALGGQSEQNRLHANQIFPADLSVRTLRVALICLGDVLLLPGRNTVIDRDHYLLWTWLGDVLLIRPRRRSHTPTPDYLRTLEANVDLLLISKQMPMPISAIHSLPLASVYSSFPLLESTLKRVARRFVANDGTVKARFRGLGQIYQIGNRCNSVGDLLFLVSSQIARGELQKDLEHIRSHLNQFCRPGQDPYKLIYDWRNFNLHGQGNHTTISGTMLTLALRLQLYDARKGINSKILEARRTLQREMSLFQTSSQPSLNMVQSKYLMNHLLDQRARR